MSLKVYIKENSWIARLSAYKLSADNCATVVGSTVHLYNTSRHDFLKNTAWVRHEVCHVKQWNEKGYTIFLFLYLYWSIRFGYYHNPFEQAAREAEKDMNILEDVEIVGE